MNTETNDIFTFLHALRTSGGSIWLENNSLRLSTKEELKNELMKEFLLKNKQEIIGILSDNSIVNRHFFQSKVILKNPSLSEYPISFSQERIFFIEQYEGGSNAYHIPQLFQLSQHANVKGIEYALQKIVERHEVLRSTICESVDNKPLVLVSHERPLSIDHCTLDASQNYELLIKEEISRPFDLKNEYPVRAKLYTIGSNGHASRTLLLIIIHHIASDGWSTNIFSRELASYYNAYVENNIDWSQNGSSSYAL